MFTKRANTKVVKSHTFRGYGFPVAVSNAPMVRIGGEWTLDVDLHELERAIAHTLLVVPWPLRGAEVHFIRAYLRLTMEGLARVLGVSHAAVVKWEKRAGKPAGMKWGNEALLRLRLKRELDGQAAVGELLDALGSEPEKKPSVVSVDLTAA